MLTGPSFAVLTKRKSTSVRLRCRTPAGHGWPRCCSRRLRRPDVVTGAGHSTNRTDASSHVRPAGCAGEPAEPGCPPDPRGV